ncbi:DUF4097 family beta strand repeat-containing protein [Streptomyces sp. LNU-CPARS28]|uniref:DUF4097 family beta strand repeat-containing protein n=1 Tax=Streptomyces sp. LNU-CPARS28 TaxID=3137371 RepID=UPI0031363A53
MPEWSVAEPRKLTFEEPVRTLRVRVVNGMVNVVGTDEDSARLEVSEISGPPLTVTQHDGTLSVAYDDLPWKGFLEWLDPRGTRRRTVISLAVPAGTRVEVGAIGAGAVVTGIEGRTEVRGITGDTTLVGLTGPVRAETVSGNVAAQGVTGDLRFDSVSGDLTVFDGSGSSVRAESVSGAMIVDLDPATGSADVGLTSISGEIAVRLPHPAHAEVRADTASGSVSSDFDDLRVSGQWGAKKLTGKLGSGSGRLRAKTISGSIALLRKPSVEEDLYKHDLYKADEPSRDAPPSDSPLPTPPSPAATPSGGQDADTPADAPKADAADGPTDKKVL